MISNAQKILDWWERALIIALALSVALLGIGRIEFLADGGSVSSWSVSRTTFLFWVTFKLIVWMRSGWPATDLQRFKCLTPLFIFFIAVTVSLLPNFRAAGDYRYFVFGCAHTLMVIDLFWRRAQTRWLIIFCGVLPLVLVVRGLVHDPSVFYFVLAHRFEFPLDHANTAGYVFAMSIPLALGVTMSGSFLWRSLAGGSLVGQVGALLLTYSRGAWLGCAAGVLSFIIAARKWKYLAVIVGLAAGCLLLSPSLQERFRSLSAPGVDKSLASRGIIVTNSLKIGWEHPLLGIGYGRGRFKDALRPHLKGTPEAKDAVHAHNVYADIFAGTGIIGLLAFVWLLATTLVRVIATAGRQSGSASVLGFALAGSWIAAIVTGIGDIPFYHHETRIFFFTLLGVAQLYQLSGGKAAAL